MKVINKEYMGHLQEQFKLATGVSYVDKNSPVFQAEMNGFLDQRSILGKTYAEFINYMDAYPKIVDSHTVEVGKGGLDSIAMELDSTIITPYSDTFSVTPQNLLLGNFKVINGCGYVLNNRGNILHGNAVNNALIGRFITHNPYTPQLIEDWEYLHNLGQSNITVGVYGSIYDRDREDKIKQIYEFAEKLDTSVRFECETFYDGYYCAVSSDRKILYKRLIR